MKLEKILETVKREAKGYMADTSAVFLFYNPILAANEYFLGGLEPKEVLTTRISMSIAGLFTSRLYGKFREYWAKKCKTNPDSSRLRKFVTDTTGIVVFYTPIYSAGMLLSGASAEEIAVALPAGTVIGALTGRPYGWCLDKWRKIWKVKPVLDTYTEKAKKPSSQK